jgi:predicted nuclease of predicted toxin-antitoxin system
MKLLLDENLSRRLVPFLQSNFPESSHVSLLDLEQADDDDIWSFAKANDFVIVSKDDDFRGLSAMRGHPPRLIRLSMGNCDNATILKALNTNYLKIKIEFTDPLKGFLVIS